MENLNDKQQKVAEETLDWFLKNNPERIFDLLNGNHKQLLIDAFDAYKVMASKFDHNSKEMDAFVALQGEKIFNQINNPPKA